jgi:hypothetical protein
VKDRNHEDYKKVGGREYGNGRRKACSKSIQCLDTGLNFKTDGAVFAYALMAGLRSDIKYGKEQHKKNRQGDKPGKQFFVFCHISSSFLKTMDTSDTVFADPVKYGFLFFDLKTVHF